MPFQLLLNESATDAAPSLQLESQISFFPITLPGKHCSAIFVYGWSYLSTLSRSYLIALLPRVS